MPPRPAGGGGSTCTEAGRDRRTRTNEGVGQASFVYRTGRVYKGKPRLRRGRRQVVRSSLSKASCGLSRRVGALTGLFLMRADGRWQSNLCLQIPARRMRRVPEAPGCVVGGDMPAIRPVRSLHRYALRRGVA
jgi:hypothetical protein